MSQELMWKLTKRETQGMAAICVDTWGDEMLGSGSLTSSDQCSSTFTTATGSSAVVLDTGATKGVRAPTTARARRRQPRAEDLERIMENLLLVAKEREMPLPQRTKVVAAGEIEADDKEEDEQRQQDRQFNGGPARE